MEVEKVILTFVNGEKSELPVHYLKAASTLYNTYNDVKDNLGSDETIEIPIGNERASPIIIKLFKDYIDIHDPQLSEDYNPVEKVLKPIEAKFAKYNEPKKEISKEVNDWFLKTFGSVGVDMKRNKLDDFVETLEYIGCSRIKRNGLIYLAKLLEAEVVEGKSVEEIVTGMQRVMGLPETGPIDIQPHLEAFKKELEEKKARGEKDEWDIEFDHECEFRYKLKYDYYESYLKLKTELEIGEYLTEEEWAKPEGYDLLHDKYLRFIVNENDF